jgi:hypothetical protein
MTRRGCAAAAPVAFIVALIIGIWLEAGNAPAQQSNDARVIHGIDAEVQARVSNVEGFTDIEHYAVYRGDDETHPAAEMTAKDTYKKGAGKTYTILSQSGSGIVLKYGLHPLLDNEESINEPGKVDESWFTAANYEMKLEPGGVQTVNGRACYALEITPKHKAPNMIDGTLWVDAKDYSIVKVQGVASKAPSIFAGTTHMMRDYVNIDGYPMATHARAESKSFLFGRTVVIINYSDYHLQTRGSK